MAITAEALKEKLEKELDASYVEVDDISPTMCGASFKVLVVSAKFEGKPLLQRHRLVNAALVEELKEIHAFQQKTLTPEQWQKEKAPQ
ncbi:unnamed protein product [Lampetra planeri]